MPAMVVDSPLGPLRLESDGEALTRIDFGARPGEADEAAPPRGDEAGAPGPGTSDPLLAETAHQLAEYFAGTRTAFDLPLRPAGGTEFQRRVWAALEEIPYGETWTYGQLAAHIGRPAASRAVGAGCGRNPLPIVVPCHRVIGADGSLTGYAGGEGRKAHLLQTERRTLAA